MKNNYDLKQLDKILKEICENENSNTCFLNEYDEEYGKYLQSLGYIDLKYKGNYLEASATPDGKRFFRNGGFVSEEQEREKHNEYGRASYEASLSAVKQAKWASIQSWIAIAVSILSIIVSALLRR